MILTVCHANYLLNRFLLAVFPPLSCFLADNWSLFSTFWFSPPLSGKNRKIMLLLSIANSFSLSARNFLVIDMKWLPSNTLQGRICLTSTLKLPTVLTLRAHNLCQGAELPFKIFVILSSATKLKSRSLTLALHVTSLYEVKLQNDTFLTYEPTESLLAGYPSLLIFLPQTWLYKPLTVLV